jgi:uncharacterized protein (TIGR02996 family)
MSALRRALEEALLDDFDDRAAHAAYADLLMESDDQADIARGEFSRVQLALEDERLSEGERQRLKQRESELLAEHEQAWLVALAPFVFEKDVSEWRETGMVNRCDWSRGWVKELFLYYPTLATARALARCSVMRLLQGLHLEHNTVWRDPDGKEVHRGEDAVHPEDGVPEGVEYPTLYLLRDAPFLPALRVLRVGEAVDYEEETYDSSCTSAEGVVELVRRTVRLEELYLAARVPQLDELFALPSLTRLRILQVYHCLDEYPLGILASNPVLKSLTTLRVHPAHSDDDSLVPRSEMVKLLRSPHLPALTHLYLRGSDLGNEGCKDIVESGILKKLKVLDLRHGCIQDDGARILATCPDVGRLQLLDLVGNELAESGQAALQGLACEVHCDGQNEPDSNAFLWSGDIE